MLMPRHGDDRFLLPSRKLLTLARDTDHAVQKKNDYDIFRPIDCIASTFARMTLRLEYLHVYYSLALSNSFLYALSLTDRSGCEGHVEDVLEDMTGKILVLLMC